jgi:uncharacterized membrane protein required for colicin V production
VPGYGLHEATADFLLVVIVGVNCYMGWRYGLVRRAVALAAVYGACLAAFYVGNPVATTFGPGGLMANGWAFVAIFWIVVVMIEILAALYSDVIRRTILVMFDRVTGLVVGLAVGVLEFGVLVLVAQAVANAPPSTTTTSSADRTTAIVALDHGVLTQLVVQAAPGLQRALGPAIPSSLQDHLDGQSGS